MQSLATGRLSPRVTGVIVSVPAGGDTQNVRAGRPNWPTMRPPERRDEIPGTSRYYDAAHFAAGIRVPTFVSAGLPEAFRAKVLAAYQAPVPVMGQSGNAGQTNGSDAVSVTKNANDAIKPFPDDPPLNWAANGGTRGVAPPAGVALPYAGFYATRGGWKPDDAFLSFKAGPSGAGHEHEDKLEAVLRAWDQNLLIDPGNFAYDKSPQRRYAATSSARRPATRSSSTASGSTAARASRPSHGRPGTRG